MVTSIEALKRESDVVSKWTDGIEDETVAIVSWLDETCTTPGFGCG
jgi:hypothetical protein